MSLNTSIEWTDHSLNLWWGCFKVSPGCKFCYADTLDNRYNHNERNWGPNSKRKLVRSWKKNLNEMRKSAIANGRRETVFVMSMGDIFEDNQPLSNNHDTKWETINDVRQEFFGMVNDYPELIFLLLTKRPENVLEIAPYKWAESIDSVRESTWPENLWIGASIVNQSEVSPRLNALGNLPLETFTFVSAEPLLGPIEFGEGIAYVDWVIVGGESGPKARPMHPNWARAIRDEVAEAGIPFHFKQWGENYPVEVPYASERGISNNIVFEKRGKHNSGNTIDGKQHLEFPESFHQPLK